MQLPSTKYIDKTFWAIFILLVFVATVALASASSTLVYSTGNALGPLMKQVMWFIVGIIGAFCVQYVPSRFIRMGGYLVLLVSLFCLYVMLIPHNPFVVTINGAGRWFNLFGFRFQPSELAKPILLLRKFSSHNTLSLFVATSTTCPIPMSTTPCWVTLSMVSRSVAKA